ARFRDRDDQVIRAEQRLRQRLGVEGVDDVLRRQYVARRLGAGRNLHLRRDHRREKNGYDDGETSGPDSGHRRAPWRSDSTSHRSRPSRSSCPAAYFFAGVDSWWYIAHHLPFFRTHTVLAYTSGGNGCPAIEPFCSSL